jgi:DNA-directed RNA polymerase specialized sigma24 family protein
MGTASDSSVSSVTTIQIPRRLKNQPDRLPWPRVSEDEPRVALGVDVVAKRNDIIKIVHKFFKVDGVSMDELLQEVYVAILHKNRTRSAHDSRKSSFGHYVYMIANNVCINLVNRIKRQDREKDSIYAPSGREEGRSILETVEDPTARINRDETLCHMKDVESVLVQHGMWVHIRYLRSVNSGANPDVVREALSFGGKKVSNKNIRDIRIQIRNIIGSSMY